MSSIKYINSVTLTDATPSITFSNIPDYYEDLIVNVSGYGTVNDRVINFRFNGVSSGSLYSTTRFLGYSAGVFASRYENQNQYMAAGNWSDANSSYLLVNILSYSNNNIFKTLLSEWKDNTEGVGLHSGLFRSTDSISSIEISVNSGNHVAGSTFTLWGVT